MANSTTVKNSNVDPLIIGIPTITGLESVIKNSNTDITANSLPQFYPKYYAIKDKNNQYMSWVTGAQYANGTTLIELATRKKVNGTSVDHTLGLKVDNNGNREVNCNKEAWRSALGMADSGWLSYTDSSIFSGTIYYRKIGNLVQITQKDLYLKAQLNAHSQITLGIIPDGYRPSYITAGSVTTWSDISKEVNYQFIVNSSGHLYLYSNSLPILTTYNIFISAMYFTS